jgi:Cytosolic domain of 10TM putative phosphate transporter
LFGRTPALPFFHRRHQQRGILLILLCSAFRGFLAFATSAMGITATKQSKSSNVGNVETPPAPSAPVESTPLLFESNWVNGGTDNVTISEKEAGVIGEDGEGGSEHLNDSLEEMTLSRRIAIYLSQFSWYCPTPTIISTEYDSIDKQQRHQRRQCDNLHRGWYYYEHYTLARHEGKLDSALSSAGGVKDKDKSSESSDVNFVRANRGEQDMKTYLYPVMETPETDLADFGQGIGIYFYSLRMLSVLLFMAGIMSIPNLIFFSSTEWNPNFEFDYFHILRTSAVCTTQPWKACPNCTRSDWSGLFPPTYDRYAETLDGQMAFIRINDCHITRTAGLVGMITMIVVVLGVWLISKAANWRDSVLDRAQQTTRDYGVQVRNPPKDASSPEEWRNFFSQFGHVTSITIVKDNDKLLMSLLERRQLISQLEDILPPDVEIDQNNLNGAVKKSIPISTFSKVCMGMLDGPTIHKKIHEIDDIITNDLSMKPYEVSEVFVVYEREADQQAALRALQVPLYAIHRNNIDVLEKREYLFRSNCMLRVDDPPEPSNVIWQNLNYTVLDHIRQRMTTFIITVICIVLGCFFVVYVKITYGTVMGAFAVSAVTSAAPYISQYITL